MNTSDIWFESAGTRLYAVEMGSGDPIVLIHGGLANHLACTPYGIPLADSCRVILPDLRGAGRSHFAGPLTWNQLADDIAALIRHLGLARAVIGGVSFGAGVAVRVALRHPDVVRGLVLLAPAYGGAELGLTAMQQAAMTTMNDYGSRVVAHGIDALMPVFDNLPPDVRDRVKKVAAAYDPASVATTTAFMASLVQPFERVAELAAITAPALVVSGLDPFHPREVAEVFRALPAGRLVDADPTQYAAAIGEFVAARAAQSTP